MNWRDARPLRRSRMTTAKPRSGVWILTAMTGLIGCDAESPDSTPVVTRSDSAGIELVTSREAAWRTERGWSVTETPSVQIGRREGSEEELLYSIVKVRSLGRDILVAQATDLRVYSESGDLIRRMGGRGQGPGEFQQIASALPCGEQLFASELLPSRLTVFSPLGEAETVFVPHPEAPGRLNPFIMHACTPAGIVGTESRVLVHLDLASLRLDTLMSYPGPETYEGLLVPFGRATLVLGADTLIYVVDTGMPEVRIFAHDGSLRRVFRIAQAPRAVTPDDISRIREQYLEDLPSSLEAEIRERLDALTIPSTMPHFSELQVAPDGTIWLAAYQAFRDEPTTTWTVIGPDGRLLGEIDLPPDFTIHEIGNEDLLGVWTDEFDVQYVRRYQLRR